MKVVIVGGVAGGGSCAARLRRLDEKAEIIIVERGPYVSYANCGLPYHFGGVIEKGSPFLAGMYQYSGIQAVKPKTRAVVIGGGFIGLESAENLVHQRFEVTIVERNALTSA